MFHVLRHIFTRKHSLRPLVRDLRPLKKAGPVRVRPAMHLYITHAHYFEAIAQLGGCVQSMLIQQVFHVDPTSISALVACRLIALDKCPGVRPIGVGETVRRIIGKSIATALASEIQQAAGPLQMCAGHLSGCEAAVHLIHNVFQSSISEGVILVDACNAFNSINRETALRNIQHLCPPIAKILINTYCEDIQLFIDGATILSQEGTTQGDPLAMAMYAIAITPLIRSLEDEKIKQVWFADDATAGGSLLGLRRWWDHLVERGSAYGYYPNPAKTCLVLNEKKMEMAKEVFQGTGISITEEGKHHLGAATGTQAFVDKYVMQRVSEWVNTRTTVHIRSYTTSCSICCFYAWPCE